MSEAELHMLKARLQGGILSKAKRGELKQPLPTGLIYTANNEVVLDPDSQVQETLKTFFITFERLGSAMATVRYFHQNNLLFPRRIYGGAHKGELTWSALTHWKVLQTLHNPRYAGAFCYGRGKRQRLPDGSVKYKTMPLEQWDVLLKDSHPGYITWQQYERHVQQLEQNSRAYGHDHRQSPPREGPALLQGLIYCGRCGEQMTLRYMNRKGGLQVPTYMCQRKGIETASECCQCIPGGEIDKAISQLILDSVTPLTIDVALEVQKELEMRANEVILLHQKQVERARYDVDMARTRFMKVDPSNRLVADTLEAEWNEQLKALESIQAEHERVTKQEYLRISEKQQQEIMQLASDFPTLWKNPTTPNQEKKRIVRLIIEDVTLTRGEDIQIAVRFQGGAKEILKVPLPQPVWVQRKTDEEIVKRIDELLDTHSLIDIVDLLNQEGRTTGTGSVFTRNIVAHIRENHGLKSRRTRMQERGYFTTDELAQKLDICASTIRKWAQKGVIAYDTDGRDHLYKMPNMSFITHLKKQLKPGRKSLFIENLSQKLEEVQYEV